MQNANNELTKVEHKPNDTSINIRDYKSLIYASINELRGRIIICLSLFLCVFAAVFYFSDAIITTIFDFLTQKSTFPSLFTQNLSTAFTFRIKISFYAAFALCMPVFLYHLYCFISLGLFKNERKIYFYTSTLGVLLGYAGFTISALYLLPLCITFFNSMQIQIVKIQYIVELNSFLSLCFTIGMCGFITFQTPIVIFLLLKYKFLTISGFSKFRKAYIPIYLIIGGIITPPDVLSQVICCIIMILLTEIGFVAYFISHRLAKKRRAYTKQKKYRKISNNSHEIAP